MIDTAKPERAQVMKIAGAIKNERRKVPAGLAFEFFIKFFNDSPRRAEAKSRPPFTRIEGRQMQRLVLPGVVEIKMKCARQRLFRN